MNQKERGHLFLGHQTKLTRKWTEYHRTVQPKRKYHSSDRGKSYYVNLLCKEAEEQLKEHD